MAAARRIGATVAALEACGGRIFGPAGAAARLGLEPTTLLSRMKAAGIRRDRFRGV